MSQNRSAAVMQQRSEPHSSLDDFPTPPWATRALLAYVFGRQQPLHLTCREPAANRGHMVRPLAEWFGRVEASDIFDYGAGFPQCDYLFGPDPEPVDWTITNPPFRLAEQFIERARRTSRGGVAMIVRSAFLEGSGRYSRLFALRPPHLVLQFTERVLMLKGRLVADGAVCPKLGRKVTSATAYSWLVWDMTNVKRETRLDWIGPSRKRLERAGDYEAVA